MTLLVSRKEETLECISFSKILSIFEIREIGRILIGIQLGQENFWKEVYRMDFFLYFFRCDRRELFKFECFKNDVKCLTLSDILDVILSATEEK